MLSSTTLGYDDEVRNEVVGVVRDEASVTAVPMTSRCGSRAHREHVKLDRRVLRAWRHQLQQSVQPPARLHRARDMHRRLGHQLHQHRGAKPPRDDQPHKLHPHWPRRRRPSSHVGVHSLRATHEHQNRTSS